MKISKNDFEDIWEHNTSGEMTRFFKGPLQTTTLFSIWSLGSFYALFSALSLLLVSLVKRNVSRKLTFLHNTVTWRYWIATRLNSDKFYAVIETASNVWESVIRKDVEMEESDYIFIVIFFLFFFFTWCMIYVIISCHQVYSAFILKVIALFNHLNGEKSSHEK